MAAARTETRQGVIFAVENDRVRNVILKLARGHVAFEQNEPQLDGPSQLLFAPFTAMSSEQRAEFEVSPAFAGYAGWPGVASRAMIRLIEGQDLDADGRIEVQPERYRYRVQCDGGYSVQIVFREYLAAQLGWD
jgi:hypothetical protein